MKMRKMMSNHAGTAIALFDILVLGGYWYCIPYFKRPLDGLLAVVAVLGVATAIVSRRHIVRAASVIAVSLACTLFGLEMGQRFFNLTDMFVRAPAGKPVDGGGNRNKYAWDPFDPATYLEAKERARRDGVEPEALREDFAGDVFAGVDKSKLRIRSDKRGKRIETTVSEGESPFLRDPPLGSELRPDNMFRQYCTDQDSGAILFDGVCRTSRFGFRETRGNEKAGETYIFMGCSFTFGSYLSDHQTMPHYYSELHGFAKRVINLAIGGNGPHHSLRDLELNYRPGKAGVDAAGVKGVFYGFIDDHVSRVVSPNPPESPRYVLKNGRLELAGTFSGGEGYSRFSQLLMRSRIYPELKQKLTGRTRESDFELTYAIFDRMNRICRERYGIPLTVVYWDDTPEVARRLKEMGIRLLFVSDALGKDWRDNSIQYLLIDGHPSAYANKKLAEYLYRQK